MHGYIINQFALFLISIRKLDSWEQLAGSCGLPLPVDSKSQYENAVFDELLSTYSQSVAIEESELLNEFGRFLIKSLLESKELNIQRDIVQLLIDSKAELDYLLDPHFHEIIPNLQAIRVTDSRVEIIYHTGRDLPELGIGLIEGLAEYTGDRVDVSHMPVMDGSHLLTVEII
ncbi:MAG: heme NO-binding domain-containing protein [Cyclobacteriaceae bacterium]